MTLVERLRLRSSQLEECGLDGKMLIEAADHIESLQRECEALRAAVDEEFKACTMKKPNCSLQIAQSIRDQREGK